MRKFNLEKFYQKLEKRPKLIFWISFPVFLVFSLFGFLIGNNYYMEQKKKMMVLRETQKKQETEKIEKIFSKFPEKRFFQMIKQE